jgi:hypothetical protein
VSLSATPVVARALMPAVKSTPAGASTLAALLAGTAMVSFGVAV